MTYAEQFQVGSWLETPAKWLQWAQASLVQKQVENCAHNLRQFWASIQGYQNLSPAQWAEVLQLNAESQACLSSYYMAQQFNVAYELAKYAGNSQFLANMGMLANPSTMALGAYTALTNNRTWNARFEGVVNWFRDQVDFGSGEKLKAQVQDLGAKAQEAAQKAATLAQQSKSARAQAGASSTRGERLVTVTGQRTGTTAKQAGMNNQTAAVATRKETPAAAMNDTLSDISNFKILGLPWWLVAAGGVAVVALLMPSPMPRVSLAMGGSR